MRHVASTTAVNILLLLLGLLTSTFASRLLGPQGRGEVAAVQNFTAFLCMLAMVGLPDALTYSSARSRERSREWLTTALLISITLALPVGLIGSAALSLALGSQRNSIVDVARVYLLSIPFQICASFPFNCLQGALRMARWNALRLAGPLLWLTTLTVCWWTSADGIVPAEKVLKVHAGALVVYAVIIFLATNNALEGPFIFRSSAARQLVHFGSSAALSAVPQQLNLRFDQLLMAAWLPPALLGKYAVSVAWSNLVSSLTQAAGQIAFPSIANTESIERRREIGGRVMRCSIAGGCTVSIAWGAASILLFPLFMGQAFEDTLYLLAILIPAAAIASVSSVTSQILKGLGRPRDVLFAVAWGLVATVILLMLLLRRFQLVGASITSFMSYGVSLLVGLINVKKALGVSARELLVPSSNDWLFPARLFKRTIQSLLTAVPAETPV